MSIKQKNVSKVNSKFIETLKVNKKDTETMIAVKQSLNEIFAPMLVAGSQPISSLPDATLPLDGTELLPIVQGGVTDKINTADFGSNPLFNATSIQSVFVDPTPSNAQGLVHFTGSGKFENKNVTFRNGSSVVPIGINSTGAFVDFQSFTLPANFLTGTETIVYEIQGNYSNACTMQVLWNGSPINWVTSGPLISISAPTVTNQSFELTWEITRFSATQANTFLKIIAGYGVNQFVAKYSGLISLIDWTVPITFGAQGRCDVAVLTLDSLQGMYFIK